jgi:hypothetical protein
MTEASTATVALLDPRKFCDPERTADGQKRASVALEALETLWFNTGTLCNLTCRHCYIESSPTNDSLIYLSAAEVNGYLDEIAALGLPTQEIGFTGGEPFMNPAILAMLQAVLERGFRTLVLTNAMRPMMKCAEGLAALNRRFGARLAIRVSVDHYTRTLHEVERGQRSWATMIEGLTWLSANGFDLRVAGRSCWRESEAETRKGYARLFAELGLAIDAGDPEALVIFPEMDAELDVPEITERCWGLLGVSPKTVMCASSRMVVKRKGEERPVVVPCALLPCGDRFVMGETLAQAFGSVQLNHPHCARFCVLGGGSCSTVKDPT